MEQLDDKAYDKEVKVKGINTEGEAATPIITEPEDPTIKVQNEPEDPPPSSFSKKKPTPFPKAFEYKTPTTPEQGFFQGVTSGGIGSSTIKGDAGMFNYDQYAAATAPIDLAQYIPNGIQREKFIEEYGSKLVQLSPSLHGIKFQNDIEDAIKFKESNNHLYMKNFLDEISASQSTMEKMSLASTNLIGGTLIHGSGLLPVFYGIGSAMWNFDSSKIFDNAAFDLWEGWSEGLNKYTAVYANSDVYDYNKETGEFKQKDFFARFLADPSAAIANDVAPTITFVTGMIVSELAATALAPFTGGTSLISNTARLTAQTVKMFNKIKTSKSIFSKSMKALRGLDTAGDDLMNMATRASVNRSTEAFRNTLGTAVGALRSASYESALIGRSISEGSLNQMLVQYHIDKGGETDEEGNPVGELIKPTKGELEGMEKFSKDAGVLGFWANIPLVAGSNFIQFSKFLQRGYTVSKTGTKIGTSVWDKYKFKGTRIVDGKRIANVDANKYFKALGYTGAFIKSPITEGWEEFAQGAMEEGLVDYYSSIYSKQASFNYFDLLSSITDHGRHYLDTVEGRDAVTLGALMGAFGARIPGVKRNKEGKLRPTFKAYGGSFEAVRELRADAKIARERAEKSLASVNNEVIVNNLKNTMRHMSTQLNMDEAALAGDVNEFKNQEHQQLFSLAYRHHANGTQEVLLQDFEALEALPLSEFNALYNLDAENKFTQKEKDATVKKARRDVETMLESISEVESIMDENPGYSIEAIGKEIRKSLKGNEYVAEVVGRPSKDTDPLTAEELRIAQGIKEQLAYLNHSIINAKDREKSLKTKIEEITKNTFPVAALELIKATPKGLSLQVGKVDPVTGLKVESTVEFTDSAKEVVKATMQEWKQSDINSYNQHSKKVEKLVEDLAQLKLRQARAAALYNGMFTPKGAKLFREFAIEIESKKQEAILEYMREELAKKAKEPKSATQASNIRKDAESVGEAGKSAIQELDKKVVEGLEKYKALDKEKLGFDEFERQVLEILNENPALFAVVKDYAIENLEEVVTARNVEELATVDSDGTETAALFKAMKELSTNFKSSVPKQSRNLFDDVVLDNQPALNGKEDIERAIDEDSQAFFQDLDTTVTSDDFIYINVNDKQFEYDRKTKKRKAKIDLETGRPIDDAKKEELKLDVNKLNSPDFLNNSTIIKDNVVFHLRVSETSEYNQGEDVTPYDMLVEVYHIDPVSKQETKIGQLPAFKEGGPAGLKIIREKVFTRFRRKKFFGNVNSIEDYKKRKEEVIEQLKTLQKEKTEISKLQVAETRKIVDKIIANKQFIKGKKEDGTLVDIDSGEEYVSYYNTKTYKEYKRVTSFLFEGLTENEWLTSANKIGTATDKVVRDVLSGTLTQESKDSDLEGYNLSDIDTVRNFINQITEFKKALEGRGETILANDIVLYDEKLGIAGTVDVLTYTSDGKFKIYDMKTMRGDHLTQTIALYNEEGSLIEEANKYDAKSYYDTNLGAHIQDDSRDSRREKHQKQLSLYRILLANTHGVVATELEVIPIVVDYNQGETRTTELNLKENIKVTPLDKVSDKDAEVNAVLSPEVKISTPTDVTATDKKAEIERKRQESLKTEGYKGALKTLPKSKTEDPEVISDESAVKLAEARIEKMISTSKSLEEFSSRFNYAPDMYFRQQLNKFVEDRLAGRTTQTFSDWRRGKTSEEINAKYDAELAALEGTVSDKKAEGTNSKGTTYKGETTEKDGLKVTEYSEFRPDGKRISKGGRIMTPSEFIEEYNITDQDYLDSLEEATEIRIYQVRIAKDGTAGISIQGTFPEGNEEMEVAGVELAALEEQTTEAKIPIEDGTTESTVEIDAAILELKAELESLNLRIKGSAPSFEYTQEVKDKDFGDFVTDFTTYNRKKNPKLRQELVDKYGKERVDRYEAINENFDSIVTQITGSGINIFFDPESGTHKNC